MMRIVPSMTLINQLCVCVCVRAACVRVCVRVQERRLIGRRDGTA